LHSPWFSLGVLALRITEPGLDRPFRAPAIWIVAPAGAAMAVAPRVFRRQNFLPLPFGGF
jgi:hypothetical protein